MKLKNARKAEWFTNPQMLGHYQAIDKVLYAEEIITKFAKSALQKKVAKYVIQDLDSWNFWCMYVSKKDLHMLRWVLRRLKSNTLRTKGATNAVRVGHSQRTGVLKDRLTWILEALAYKHDKEAYFKSYASTFGFYGLSTKESSERFEEYHTKQLSKDGLPV